MNIKKTGIVIKTASANLEGRNLRPLKDYKGVLLELNDYEKKQIAEYESKISAFECELYNLYNILNKEKRPGRQDFWCERIMRIEYEIDKLNELIKEIKVNRFNFQKKYQK